MNEIPTILIFYVVQMTIGINCTLATKALLACSFYLSKAVEKRDP